MGALPNFPVLDPDEQPSPRAPQPTGPVLLPRAEPADSLLDLAPRAGSSVRLLLPFVVNPEPAPPAPSPVSPSFRNLLIFATIAVLLAACLALILGFSSSQPAKPAATRTNLQLGSAVHPAKPSAYGEAFVPPAAAPRHHRSAQVAAATPGN